MKLKKKDWAYYLFQLLRYPVRWFMDAKLNLNLVKNEAKDDEGPFFLTGNHVTAYDAIIALVYCKPLIKFVGADANYDNKLKKFLLNSARVIPIEKRNMDIRTIKRLLAEVKAGNAVGLYAEGGRTWSGETEKLIYSTAKLIKMLGIKVYNQKLEGAYMTSPRWGKTLYKGQTNVTIYKILDPEDIQKMSADDIFAVLKKETYHNDYTYQRKEMVPLQGKDRAEYIERFIYVCPHCHVINSFKSYNNHFKCIACDTKGHVNAYGFLEGDFPYDNLVDWNHFQKDYLAQLSPDSLQPLELFDVQYKTNTDHGKKQKGLCDVVINLEGVIIQFKETETKIPWDSISEPSLTFKNTMIFYHNNVRHEFVIEPFLQNTSIMYIYELIMKLRGEKNG